MAHALQWCPRLPVCFPTSPLLQGIHKRQANQAQVTSLPRKTRVRPELKRTITASMASAETASFKMPVIPDDYAEQLKKMGLPSYWEENKQRDPRYQWIHPAAEVRDKPQYKGGKGLFATRLIKQGEKYFNGEFMADGMGEVVDIPTLNTWPLDKQMLFLHWCAQISATEILSPRLDEQGQPEDFGAFVNHSCDPNVLFHNGSFDMVVRRDIQPDEEITIDYGQYMISETSVKEFKDTQCGCGAMVCRGHVTWRDHLNPKLIEFYGTNWPPHAIESQIKHGVRSAN